MKKHIKLALIIIFTMFMIFFTNTSEVNSVYLSNINRSFQLGINGGATSGADLILGKNHVFCIQEGTKTNYNSTYRVKYHIKIDGTKSSIYQRKNIMETSSALTKLGDINAIENAKFAYILSQPDPGSDQYKHSYATIQKEIYGYMSTWMKKNSLITGISTNAGGYGTTNWSSKATEYANQLTSANASITNNTVTNNITKEIYDANGKTYTKVGPFNFTYNGTYSSSKVYDQNDKLVTVKYARYTGTTLNIYDSINEASLSGRDFYLLVPADVGISKINKFTATVSKTKTKIATDIWILQQKDNMQNIISTDSKVSSTTTTADVEVKDIDVNVKKHINLSGYVWEDIISTKQSVTNDLYKADSNDMMDQLVQNVTVQLIYKNGDVERVERSAITDSNGKYLFEEVLIDDLPYLHIQFTYNGMSYEAVKKGNLSAEKSSKASENGRAIFNSNYKTIEKDKSNAYSLKYDVNNYVSKIHLGDSLQYGYSGATKPVNGVYEQYQISSTVDINEIIQQVYGGNIRSSGIDEIQNINLGLKEREMPDLAVVKDLYSSKININNESYTYLYEDRLKAENQNKEAIYNMQPQVKFGQERGNQTYARPIYASDIKFTGVNKLDVKLIYRIGINNQSTNLRITVNQMVDYLDSKFETTSVKIGKGLDADGNITQIIEKSNTQLAAYNNQYSKITINPNLTIEPQSEEMIYIELTVKPENIAQIIDQGIEVKLDNIAEITSYSTQDKNGNIYGGIDNDSQPGNAVPGNTSTYEDDTDKAPGILLVLQEERSVEGSVFEDKVIQELLNSKIRQGSGTYDSGELGISGVQVTVKKENGEIAKVYNSKAKGNEEKWVDAITTTDSKGNYYIGGFVPGNYYITFTWGGKEYTLSDGTSKLITVQNYKGTIVNKETYTKNATNEFWYRDEQRNSDAIDDYNIRETIDNDNNMLDLTYKSQKQIDTSKTMNSTTPVFKINVEYPDSPIDNTAKVEYETNDDGSLKIENGYLVKKDGYKNTIKNIDFGIVERPRQTLGLEKTVNHIKLVLANGNSIIDADVDEDGNIVGKPNYISYIPKSEETKEQIKLEIDNEIVQGSTIEISYVFKVKNIGEIDYDNTDYYYYGKGYGEEESKKVTLSAIQIIDYLDNEVATDLTNTQWEEITNKNQYLDQGLISENDKMKEYINSVNRIIKTEELKDIKLKPGEEAKPLTIKVSKVLANNEETYLENNAEIIHVKKTGGSNLTTIPGNYIPTDMTTSEADNDEAEIVYIVPPTGIADNIISYVILAISTLAILVSGIILIKRFVIK